MGPIVSSTADQAKFCNFSFSANGEKLAACMNDGSVDLWSVSKAAGVYRIANIDVLPETAMSLKRGKFFNDIVFSHDENGQETVVVCDGNGCLRWYHQQNVYSSITMPKIQKNRTAGHNLFYSQGGNSFTSADTPDAWKLLGSENGGGRLSCKLSSNGLTGVLLKSYRKGVLWDLVKRVKVKSFEYKIHLGHRSRIPFPFNLSSDTDFSVVGKGEHSSGFVLCTTDTTYKEIDEQVGRYPHSICLPYYEDESHLGY